MKRKRSLRKILVRCRKCRMRWRSVMAVPGRHRVCGGKVYAYHHRGGPPCRCPAYWFIHRKGSGRCTKHYLGLNAFKSDTPPF